MSGKGAIAALPGRGGGDNYLSTANRVAFTPDGMIVLVVAGNSNPF